LPPTARWIGIFGRRLELGGLGRRYNRRTTTTPTSVTAGLTQADPCTGLTETDVTKIAEAMTAALADSTRTVYGHAWRAGTQVRHLRDQSHQRVCARRTVSMNARIAGRPCELGWSAISR
jgi:hypothetical protein